MLPWATKLKIYGTEDGVADPAGVQRNRSKLPSSATFVLLRGANHAQFGYYGSQPGNGKAGISRERQQQQVLAPILSFFGWMGPVPAGK